MFNSFWGCVANWANRGLSKFFPIESSLVGIVAFQTFHMKCLILSGTIAPQILFQISLGRLEEVEGLVGGACLVVIS